jgi:hypothetical protein
MWVCRDSRDILAKENCRGLLFSERFGGQSRTAEVAAAFPELEQSACSARPPLERVAWFRVCAWLYRSKRDCVPLCKSVRFPPVPSMPHVLPRTAVYGTTLTAKSHRSLKHIITTGLEPVEGACVRAQWGLCSPTQPVPPCAGSLPHSACSPVPVLHGLAPTHQLASRPYV